MTYPGFRTQSANSYPGLRTQSANSYPGLRTQFANSYPGLRTQSANSYPGLRTQSANKSPIYDLDTLYYERNISMKTPTYGNNPSKQKIRLVHFRFTTGFSSSDSHDRIRTCFRIKCINESQYLFFFSIRFALQEGR